MARKANIAREEIIAACWSLLEQNYFPNIPRLTEFFLKQDGRKCSNTTFLKAITEWEELYKERQETSFKELFDVFTPSFKKFERDIGQQLQSLLEERLHHEDNIQSLKRDAAIGQYLSLSQLVEKQSAQLEEQDILITTLSQNKQESDNKISYLEQRYADTLSTLQVQKSKAEEEAVSAKELTINLAQKEIDLTKLELQLSLLNEDRERLLEQLSSQQKQLDSLNQERNNADISALTKQIETLIERDKNQSNKETKNRNG